MCGAMDEVRWMGKSGVGHFYVSIIKYYKGKFHLYHSKL